MDCDTVNGIGAMRSTDGYQAFVLPTYYDKLTVLLISFVDGKAGARSDFIYVK
jgi:hypothetical protein